MKFEARRIRGAGRVGSCLGALLALLALPAAPLRADEQRGWRELRAAAAALRSGDAAAALAAAQAARLERPDDPVAAQMLADALAASGRYAEALAEYERGGVAEHARRTSFQRGTTRSSLAEALLSEAGVPAAPEALPEGPQPGMLQAITRAMPELEDARSEFLWVLDQPGDAASARAARESVAALNRRADALARIEEELRRRQEEEPESEDEDGEDGDEGEQGEDGDGEPQEGDAGDPGDNGEPPEEPQDPAEPEDEADDEQDEDQDGEDEQSPPPPAEQPQAPANEATLSPEEIRRLLDRLEQLEDAAQDRAKRREAARRRAPEKDW